MSLFRWLTARRDEVDHSRDELARAADNQARAQSRILDTTLKDNRMAERLIALAEETVMVAKQIGAGQ
jgi:hypothetical protein